MKKILGLDLGTTSIGWALVNESLDDNTRSSIIKLGVRVNPLTVDEQQNFEKGKTITTNADRTLKRSMRRNLQRFKLRRNNLIELLIEKNIITDFTLLNESGNSSTFKTYESRSNAAIQKISLDEFAKVLLMINKKRGYKSSRKANNQEEGQLIDGMGVAMELYEKNLTPGEFVYQLLKGEKKLIPDFYRSDLQQEFDKIWSFQKQFYSEVLTEENKQRVNGLKKIATVVFFEKDLKITRNEYKLDRGAKRLKLYELRSLATKQKLDLEDLILTLIEINGDISSSSGYLGAISDRSKELYFNKQTVGQYLWSQVQVNAHARLKGQVFYRKDYLDEFETIWEQQANHYPILTPELKSEIRDIIIFYQRKLKSQKGLISICEFEGKQVEFVINGKPKLKTIGPKVCPKSSPLFQEFKIWQILNNLEVKVKKTGENVTLEQEDKLRLFNELNYVEKLTASQVLKLLYGKPSELELNYKNVEGNRTNAALIAAYIKICEVSGHDEIDFNNLDSLTTLNSIKKVFQSLGINTDVLLFDSSLENEAFQKQPSYNLWHLLYSCEDDNSVTGNENLLSLLKEKIGTQKEFGVYLSNVVFQPDYGSLSTKAIRKILPYLKEGNGFDLACSYAGYNHSNSKTKEQKETAVYKDKLDLLPKNALRNPVVEKILNQMVNVVNTVISEYGKPDEIRIELARELKKSSKEREEMTTNINKAKDDHEKFRKILQSEFGLSYVTRNDIIRYKLYKELEYRGYKTLYTNTYISAEKLFSKEFDIEHIIPKAKLFDDSFSNKTLETRSANIEKADYTALEFVKRKFSEEGEKDYIAQVEDMYAKFKIGKAKRNKLLMLGKDIPDGFIERDLRDTQYIAKKAKSMLEDVFKDVNTTTGMVTDKLREDWQLVDVLKELNWNKYHQLGLTEEHTNRDGQIIHKITDWTKRNDHRHHAMDALTVAFTKRNHIQYLNNLNARSDKSSSVYGIEQKETYRDDKGKLRFKPPIPLHDFRAEAKTHLRNVLISFKAKNKVVTRNKNISKVKRGYYTKIELTPRGQLHLETVYGKIKQYQTNEIKINGSLDIDTINKVANKQHREALIDRLSQFDNDAKKAFTGKNSLDKNPIWLNKEQSDKVPERVKLVKFEDVYTIRKDITPDLKVEKVIDVKIRKILEARLLEFNGDPKKAFVNLTENPIWMNKESGITIKRVKISGISNAVALHSKKDNAGKFILDENGSQISVDFVNTGNNHHVAFYKDAEGNLHDEVVPFYTALERINQGVSPIDKTFNQELGWQFQFSMKQNEFFVFPHQSSGFNPIEIDLMESNNIGLISPNLYRVQTISKVIYGNNAIRDYKFRHHLETVLNDDKLLKEITYKSIKSLSPFKSIVKVRINHLGRIVGVGEY